MLRSEMTYVFNSCYKTKRLDDFMCICTVPYVYLESHCFFLAFYILPDFSDALQNSVVLYVGGNYLQDYAL